MQSGVERDTPWSRYPYARLPVWLLAEHSYCEKRLELWLEDPGQRVSVPRDWEDTPGASSQEGAAAAGKLAHALMAATAAVGPREAIEREGRVYLAESPFSASFDGLPIAGVPDVACLDHGRATEILDYKFSQRRRTGLPMWERAQLNYYGYLLEESGYDASDLLLICVYLAPEASSVLEPEASEVAAAITRAARRSVESAPPRRNWGFGPVALAEDVSAIGRCFFYNRDDARRDLTFASEFWHGRRPAKPPLKNPWKCSSCLYNASGRCPDALAPFRGGPEFTP